MEAVRYGVLAWRHVRFTRGDLDAVTQLFLNNVGTTLVVASMLTSGYDPRINSRYASWYSDVYAAHPELEVSLSGTLSTLIYTRTIVGLALSIAAGSWYYSWLALRLGNGGTKQLTALPFGINTPAAFAFLGGILLPAAKFGFDKCKAEFGAAGDQLPSDIAGLEKCVANAARSSWQQGVLCNFVCGMLCVVVAFFGNAITRYTPRVALLTSIASISVAFLVIAQLTLNFADPVAGMLPVMLMFLGYFSGVSFWVLPTSVAIVLAGTMFAWATGQVTPAQLTATFPLVGFQGAEVTFYALGDWSTVGSYLGIIVPFTFQSAVGTLMNVASAAKAGDHFPVRESIIVDGVASCLGAIFGTPMMTSVYIGHPGFKLMGATAGYTLGNAVLLLVFALFGLFSFINGLIPPSALAPVIAFIGFIITSEALEGLPARQVVAFTAGLIPCIIEWAGQNGLAGFGPAQFGYIAMGGNGAMLFSMVLASIVAFSSDRNFLMATAWSVIAALLAAFGLLHQESASVAHFSTPHGRYCINLLDPVGAVSANAYVAYSNTTAPGQCADGFLRCNDGAGCGWAATTQWRFAVAYLMAAVLFLALLGLQRKGKPSLAQIRDDDPQDDMIKRAVDFPKGEELNAHVNIEEGPSEDHRANKRTETL